LSAWKLVAVPGAPTAVVVLVIGSGAVVGDDVEARPPTRIPNVVNSERIELVAVATFRPVALPFRMQFLTVLPFALVTAAVATASRTTLV